MGLLWSPSGANFFTPDHFRLSGASEEICEGLSLNVLKSLQFSYMLMKRFRSTSRALRDLDMFRNAEIDRTAERSRWGSAGAKGGVEKIVSRTGTWTGIGRFRLGRSSRAPERVSKDTSRRVRCVADSPGTRDSGEGNLGRNGSIEGSAESKTNKAMRDGKGPSSGGHNADLHITGVPEEGLCQEGCSSSGGVEFSVAAESVLVRKSSRRLTSRTFLVTGLGAVDGLSSQLKPMKGFMKTVKMATGVVSGVKTATGVIQKFQAPVGSVLMGFGAANGVVLGFETARMLVKGAKISKDFASVWKSTRTGIRLRNVLDKRLANKAARERFLKGLKVSDGALTLVKLIKECGSGLGGSMQGGLSQWDLISKSYDASNSALKVFEGVLGMKGGGVIGLVGKGFMGLKGVVTGLGVSVKMVKAVVVSKEVCIALLKGFGLSKTIMEAFKAVQDGKRMVRWTVPKEVDDSLGQARSEDLLDVGMIALLLKGPRPADSTTLELLMTCAQHSAHDSQDATSSLMFSLASLLLAKFQASGGGDAEEDCCTSASNYCVFSLSLPA